MRSQGAGARGSADDCAFSCDRKIVGTFHAGAIDGKRRNTYLKFTPTAKVLPRCTPQMFRRYLLPWLVLGFYRAWTATWRTTVIHSDAHRASVAAGKSQVYAHWHRDELAIVQFVGRLRVATMTSHSKDGQLIDFVIRKLGGATAKGSSSRGGASALRGLVRLVGAQRSASFAVDGPRGPIFKSKPGVFELSKLTGAPIIPVGVASHERFIFKKSWNKARLPKPFTRVVVVFGEPLEWDAQTEPNLQCPRLAARLEESITHACRTAEECGWRELGCDRAQARGFA